MNKKFVVYGIVMTLLLCVGMSYAYFTGMISGEGKEIRVSAKELRILFTDDMELASSEIIPGWKETKTFSVKNESGNTFNYNIVINDLVNTFVTEGYLQYKITSTNGYNMTEYKDIPKSNTPEDIILAYDIDIPAGVTQEYTIEFVYHDSLEDQSDDMGKIFSGTLGIIEGTINPNVKYKVTLELENATITSLNPQETLKNGSVEFNINLNEGYTLDNSVVVCDGNAEGSIEGNVIKIDKVVRDQTCRITTEKINYNLTMNITGGSLKPANVMVAHGDSKEFTITASTGYTLDNPTITCTGGASHTLNGSTLTISNVKSNQTCSVVLKEEIKVTLIVNNGSGGASKTISTPGENLVFTGITPNTGYTFDNNNVKCTGGASHTLNGSTLTISNITSNQTCTIESLPTTIFKNKVLSDHPTRPGARPNLNSDMFVDSNTKTLYTASGSQTENGNTVYYFAGNATDNWVYFAGIYWRIIRINEDGSVRLLYVGSDKNTTSAYIKNISYSSSNDETRFIGYMYGSSTGSIENDRKNTLSSPVKQAVDSWYDENIKNNYNDFISKTAIYCNDRTNINYSTTEKFNYAARTRLIDAQAPSYKCGNDINGNLYSGTNGADIADKFTASTSTGNGKLTNPAALMTADEVVFAGGKYHTEPKAYYSMNANNANVTGSKQWWTMTPSSYNPTINTNRGSYIFLVGDNGRLNNFILVFAYGVRPVLSLKSCVKWQNGDGTSDNPYKVSIDSTCEKLEN